MTFAEDSIENMAHQISKELNERWEKAVLKWLKVETVAEAIEKIEDLRCQGLGVEIVTEPTRYKVSGPEHNIKYTAEQTIRFKIIDLKEKK